MIGLNSIILPKCKLKNFVSIAANSVVNEKVDTGNILIQRAQNKILKNRKNIKKLTKLITKYKWKFC